MARSRNNHLDEHIIPENMGMLKFAMKHGTQRLATRLVMAGMLAAPLQVINDQVLTARPST